LLIPPVLSAFPRNGGQVGLCIGILEACSAFIYVTACTLAGSSEMTRYIRDYSHFVTSMTAPVASGWRNIAGCDSHPPGNAALARRTQEDAIRVGCNDPPRAAASRHGFMVSGLSM
jgi:hypothetical protein